MLEKKKDGFFIINEKGLEELNQKELEKQEKEQLKQDLGNILFESAMDKAKIAELESNQADLLMEIALLKTGGVA